MSIYLYAIRDLKRACDRFRDREIALESLEQSVWEAAQQIVAVEEKGLRAFLMSSAGDLDVMRFTVDDDKCYDAAMNVVSRIEKRLEHE